MRWKILALLTLISIITYVDRVNISITARQMMPAFGLDQVQMGYVFSAFVLGYALFQIPGGWLGDRWGSRLVLAGAIRSDARIAVAQRLVAVDLREKRFHQRRLAGTDRAADAHAQGI